MNDIKHICDDLGLPLGDKFTQDWVYELPETYRTKNWLQKYIIAYSIRDYSGSERNLLMSLMLDIVNDMLVRGENVSDEQITNVLKLLIDNQHIHLQLINYWSLDGDNIEDCFALTPEIRKIKNIFIE